jgi:hypothetical protein
MAAKIYSHMSPERAAKSVTEATAALEDFQAWHQRRMRS